MNGLEGHARCFNIFYKCVIEYVIIVLSFNNNLLLQCGEANGKKEVETGQEKGVNVLSKGRRLFMTENRIMLQDWKG
jgi:hypothetical protein